MVQLAGSDSKFWSLRLAHFIIDREAGEIMHLVASVCLFVCVFVGMSELSCLNRLTYDLHFWHGG